MSIFDPPTTFHEWLFHETKHGPTTVRSIMEQVAMYGEHVPSFMPTNGIIAQEMLERLEREVRAARDGSWWRWKDKPEPVVVKAKESQGSLFA